MGEGSRLGLGLAVQHQHRAVQARDACHRARACMGGGSRLGFGTGPSAKEHAGPVRPSMVCADLSRQPPGLHGHAGCCARLSPAWPASSGLAPRMRQRKPGPAHRSRAAAQAPRPGPRRTGTRRPLRPATRRAEAKRALGRRRRAARSRPAPGPPRRPCPGSAAWPGCRPPRRRRRPVRPARRPAGTSLRAQVCGSANRPESCRAHVAALGVDVGHLLPVGLW